MTAQTDRLNTALDRRYRVLRHLGEGGMATVYLCEDLKHDRQVALKLLKPELAAVLGAERFVQEIKTTAALQHPHILPLFDSGAADGFLFYVMPFIDGETLRAKLDRETQLGIDDAVRIARDVANALHYAHTRGIVHRDVKPENILLHDGRPMIADFGIALAVSAAAGGRMTQTGLSLGTPSYMSPEQAMGERTIDARKHIYALGAVTYEMLVGNPPHTGASAQQIIMKIITTPAELVTVHRKNVPVDGIQVIGRWSQPAVTLSASGSLAYFPAGPTTASNSIVQVDRSGRDQVIVSKPGAYQALRLSPDGRRIVFHDRDVKGGFQLWVHDRASATTQQLTFEGNNVRPTWSPDGRRVAFAMQPGGAAFHVQSVPVDGSGPSVQETPDKVGVTTASWTRDGQWIVCDGLSEDLKAGDIFAFATSGTPRAMRPAVVGPFNEATGDVSPDGKWIAYVSNETGKYQVYIQPFLAPGAHTLISAGRATEAVWVSNTELAYMNNDADSLTLATLVFGATTTVTRTALFDARPYAKGTSQSRNFDVSRDGKHFIMLKPQAGAQKVEPIVVLHWADEMKRLMATAGIK